jgi:repressor LexA
MSVTLYKRQRQIYDFIGQYIQKNGFAPTLREIADAIGVTSLATIHEHLQALEKKGVIKKHEGTTRGIEIVSNQANQVGSKDSVSLSVIGNFDGISQINKDQENKNIKISSDLISGKKRAFALKISGNNLTSDYILNNDYLICEETSEVVNGDLVLAKLDNNNIVIKIFHKEFNRIRLDDLYDINNSIYTLNINIQGKVVGIIRKF